MLQKKFLENGKVEVTFRMPPLDGVVELNLRGDFNDWAIKGVPLRLDSDGTWVATLELDAGKAYRFRYHDNQGSWHNDWEADRYVSNSYGSDDSVVDLTTAREPAPTGTAQAERKDAARPKGGPAKEAAIRRHAKASG
jgi:1,4-alpha-glucan branching enzyme